MVKNIYICMLNTIIALLKIMLAALQTIKTIFLKYNLVLKLVMNNKNGLITS